jgi:NADH dehydrogenase FAD-containing subunit
VTIIEQADRVLPGWEPEAGQRVRQALEMRGVSVQIQRNISLEQIEQYEEGVRVPGSGKPALETDLVLVLVATGRQPNLEGLGLGALGIDDSSYLKVDKQMRLPVPGLYADGRGSRSGDCQYRDDCDPIRSELTVEQLLQMPLIQPSASEALTAVLRKVSRIV